MSSVKRYRVWTYDVVGNAEDGYSVNDRSEFGELEIPTTHEVFNVGTEREFATDDPTDAQIVSELAGSVLTYYATPDMVNIDGEPESIEIEDASDGQPICGLELIED